MKRSSRWAPAPVWLATWGGCGYFPKSPGTAGSLAAVAAAWLFTGLGRWPPAVLAALSLALLIPAVRVSDRACRHWETKDPQQVVIDEVLGQWLTLAAAPGLRWRYCLIGFVAFRVFDIWKPFPVRAAERLPGGWGVVVDDLVAGLYGAVVLLLLRQLHF
jgi:phosphatidylglycerophosphatase A